MDLILVRKILFYYLFILKLFDFFFVLVPFSLLGHWNLSHDNSNSFMKLINSLLGVTVGSNTDNAAYDMTIQSQLKWAKYLQTYPNTFYFSLTGRINFNTKETKTDTIYKKILRNLNTVFIEIFFYLIGVFDMKICDIDCSEWFHHGWDGLVSCFSQTKPSLPSPHHHPSGLIHEKLESTSLIPGHWYSWELPNDHLRLAIGCSYSWNFLRNVIEKMEKQKQLIDSKINHQDILTKSLMSQSKSSSLPDVQSIPVENFDRYTSSYILSSKEIFLAIILSGIAINIMLSNNIFFYIDNSKPIDATTSATSAITCCIGLWYFQFQYKESIFFKQFQQLNQGNHVYQLNQIQLSKNEREEEIYSFSSQIMHLSKSTFFPLLPSEGIMICFNILQIILLLLFSSLNSQFFYLLNMIRLFQLYSILLFCDRIHEHTSIFQLSLNLFLLSLNSVSTSIKFTTSFITSLYLKEFLHIISKLGSIIYHSNHSNYFNDNTLWILLWTFYLSVLSCLLYTLYLSIPLYSILSFVYIFEIFGSMKEISYSYQLFYLREVERNREKELAELELK